MKIKNARYMPILALCFLNFFTSCQNDPQEIVPVNKAISKNVMNRNSSAAHGTLTITNNTDFNLSFDLYCYGYESPLGANPDLLLKSTIPNPLRRNDSVTYKNFYTSSTPGINPDYVLRDWFLYPYTSTNPINEATANGMYGENYPSPSTEKFAHWQYLKVYSLPTPYEAVGQLGNAEAAIDLQLPEYLGVNENTFFSNIDLYNYGYTLGQFLHFKVYSLLDQDGNTTVVITNFSDTNPYL